MRPLSIVHVVAPAIFGGLESVLRGLAGGHTRLGHSVLVAIVVSPGQVGHPYADALATDGVATSLIQVGDRDYAGERRWVRMLLRRNRPDVVHTHGFRSDVVDGTLARSERIPTVSTCHGFIDSNLRGRIYQWIQRRVLRDFDAVVAVSEPIAERVRGAGVPAGKVHVVRNAFAPATIALARSEARRHLDLPDGELIGWVGRLSGEKGPDLALDAFARIDRPQARLVMIGRGPDESALRQRADTLGIADRVHWRGLVPDAGRLFPAFDVFFLSSRTEGSPVALLEAMAAKVPIVAASVGGVPDTIDASMARLVPGESIEGMASAIVAVLDAPEAARARAERARSHLDERFSVPAWLDRYESIYRQVIASAAMRTS